MQTKTTQHKAQYTQTVQKVSYPPVRQPVNSNCFSVCEALNKFDFCVLDPYQPSGPRPLCLPLTPAFDPALGYGKCIDLPDYLIIAIAATHRFVACLESCDWPTIAYALSKNPVLCEGEPCDPKDVNCEFNFEECDLVACRPTASLCHRFETWLSNFLCDDTLLRDIGLCTGVLWSFISSALKCVAALQKTCHTKGDARIHQDLIDLCVLRYPSKHNHCFSVHKIVLSVWASGHEVGLTCTHAVRKFPVLKCIVDCLSWEARERAVCEVERIVRPGPSYDDCNGTVVCVDDKKRLVDRCEMLLR